MKTIWHLLSNRWNSAITEYCLSCVQALEAGGFRNHLFVLANSPAARRALALGLAVREVSNFTLSGLFSLREQGRDHRPDVIFTYGGAESTLLRVSGYNGKVVRVRGDIRKKGRWLSRYVDQQYSGELFPSQALAEYYRGGIDSGLRLSSMVPLGIDETVFFRELGLEKPLAPELLIFGRFDAIKGHREFTRLFGQIVQSWRSTEIPQPVLRIIGSSAGLSSEELVDVARASGLSEKNFRVEEGHIADRARLFGGVTLGVIPSLGSEVICRVAEEMLMAGLPVAVNKQGALAEVLSLQGAGFSFDHKAEPAALADLFQKQICHYWQESEQENASRAVSAIRCFSLTTMAERLASFLDSL